MVHARSLSLFALLLCISYLPLFPPGNHPRVESLALILFGHRPPSAIDGMGHLVDTHTYVLGEIYLREFVEKSADLRVFGSVDVKLLSICSIGFHRCVQSFGASEPLGTLPRKSFD